MTDFKAKMHQIRFRLGLRRRPRWEILQRSQDPLAGFGGRFVAGGGAGLVKRREREGGEVEGREREGPQVTVEPGPLRALLYATGSVSVMAHFIVLLLAFAKNHMLSASRRQPHLLHVKRSRPPSNLVNGRNYHFIVMEFVTSVTMSSEVYCVQVSLAVKNMTAKLNIFRRITANRKKISG